MLISLHHHNTEQEHGQSTADAHVDDSPAQTSIPDEDINELITDDDVLAEVTFTTKPSLFFLIYLFIFHVSDHI